MVLPARAHPENILDPPKVTLSALPMQVGYTALASYFYKKWLYDFVIFHRFYDLHTFHIITSQKLRSILQ